MRRFHAALAVVALLTMAAVLPAVHGEWILDDGPLIAHNPTVQQLSLHTLHELFARSMWDLDVSMSQLAPHLSYYRPLVMLSYALDWHWGSGEPFGFHLTNMLLHALTAFLVGRALWRWTGSEPGALLGAAYFGLHPARAESVAWISGRPDVLATLAMLVALEGVALTRGRARGAGAALFGLATIVGFVSKETTLILPVLVAIELGARGDGWSSLRKAWPIWTATLGSVGYVLARLLWLPMRGDPVRGLSPITHAGFVLETLGRAALYLVAPFDLSISSSVLTERGGHVAPEAPYVWLGAGVVLLLALSLAWSARRRRRVFWALLAFLISLVPISNIVWIGGIGLTSPRFFYLPSILLAWTAIELGRGGFRAISPRLALVAGAAGALTLAALLALQSSVYASTTAFWLSELRSRPDVPGNIEFFVERDWRDGNAELALARSFCEFRVVQERFSFRGEGARIIMKTLEHWAEVTPDSDRARLSAIADFLSAAGEPQGSARLSLELSVELSPRGKVRDRLRQFAAPLLTQEAELRVRIGEPARAVALIRQARASCPRCNDLLDRQARVAYRAFEPALAEQLAQGTLDAAWGGSSKRALLERQKVLNVAIERANGAERTQLLAQRAAEAGLPAEASRLLDSVAASQTAPDAELAKLRLHFATLAGDAAATKRAASDLGVSPPPLPPGISSERTQRYFGELKNGCAYPKELAN